MIAQVCCSDKCWKITHAKPLPRGERRGELHLAKPQGISRRGFVSVVGGGSRGNRERYGKDRSRTAVPDMNFRFQH